MIRKETQEVVLAADNLAFSNGLAFTADGKELYVCESAINSVSKFKIDEEGKLYAREIFVELPGGDPDGIAFDVEENLYVGHFGGGAIIVINKEGDIIQKIATPGKKPSNVEFAGEDMKTLYITEDETNAVYKLRTEISGLRLFYFPK